VGNASKLRVLLAAEASVDINSGDSRQYTPFAAACAGGHVDCVSALLEAGCDTQLACDTGLTGWELARDLKRHEVLALQPRDTTGTIDRATSASTGAKKASKKRSSSKRSSASAGKQRGSKADERAAPLLPTGTSKVVL
jgi:ankyrin repeat protein